MAAPTGVRRSHVGLNCRDQARTEEFYSRWFGFRRARVVEADGAEVIFLRSGDVYLELFASDGTRLFEPRADGPTNLVCPGHPVGASRRPVIPQLFGHRQPVPTNGRFPGGEPIAAPGCNLWWSHPGAPDGEGRSQDEQPVVCPGQDAKVKWLIRAGAVTVM
jgi:catechol 2,3-dioxygenase-like lactoylglutathione lyase family enzyme